MVNLIAERPVVPELIQKDFTPARVSQEVLRLLNDPSARETLRAGLAEVRKSPRPPRRSRPRRRRDRVPSLNSRWQRLGPLSAILYRQNGVALHPDERCPLKAAMPLRRRICVEFAFLLVVALACAAPSLRAQVPQPLGFLADHYDISATLDSTRQSISAVAKIEFRPSTVTGSIRVELHPNLIVSDCQHRRRQIHWVLAAIR